MVSGREKGQQGQERENVKATAPLLCTGSTKSRHIREAFNKKRAKVGTFSQQGGGGSDQMGRMSQPP